MVQSIELVCVRTLILRFIVVLYVCWAISEVEIRMDEQLQISHREPSGSPNVLYLHHILEVVVVAQTEWQNAKWVHTILLNNFNNMVNFRRPQATVTRAHGDWFNLGVRELRSCL